MGRAAFLEFTDRGIYCPEGDFYIDPWRPVARALITHAHADHARPGHGAYLATDLAGPVLRQRLGRIALATLPYGHRVDLGGVTVSFHPAGHVPGSAQIRLEHRGEVWVISGDYKRTEDGLSTPFEPLRCNTFISECTFGMPLFRWAPPGAVMAEIAAWWQQAAAEGRAALLGAYALGKAQRVMAGLARLGPLPGPILTHGAVEAVTATLRAQGLGLPDTVQVTRATPTALQAGALVIAPPSALAAPWARRFGPEASRALVSGWMALRGVRRRRGMGRGFILSDHADWPALNATIAETGAERVFVTHGYTEPFARWLSDQGYQAQVVPTRFAGETAEDEGPEGTESTEGTETAQAPPPAQAPAPEATP